MPETELVQSPKDAEQDIVAMCRKAELSPAQIKVLTMVAGFVPVKKIVKACHDEIDHGEVHMGWIEHVASVARRAKKYRPIVQAMRSLLAEEVPIMHGFWRARARQWIMDQAVKGGDFASALQSLRDAAGEEGRESGGQEVHANVVVLTQHLDELAAGHSSRIPGVVKPKLFGEPDGEVIEAQTSRDL